MNYEKHYNILIERAKNRQLLGYVEQHHIIPKCLDGSDDPSNLVNLTPEEHFLAHQILVKIYPGNHQLVKAAVMMTVDGQNGNRVNNKLYGWLKRKFSIAQSVASKNKTYEERYGNEKAAEMKATRSLLRKGKTWEELYGEEDARKAKNKLSKSKIGNVPGNKGKTSPNKNKTYEELYGDKAQQIKDQKSVKLKGKASPQKGIKKGPYKKKMEQLTCPHCKLSGGANNMQRYHFDRCKYAIIRNSDVK